ncbi:hypothetical protein ABPG74_000044 [Tetrahymena malaccensis]
MSEQTNNSQTKKAVKILFILIDGIADLGLKERQNKTPLEIANLPTFDALAKSGVCGLMDPVETGLACGSDTAHMNIFGYIPFTLYRGRGAFESMGAGLHMDCSDIAFKCNFAHMEAETRIVKMRRVDRDFDKWGLPLIDYVNGMKVPEYPEHHIKVQHATEHRCGVILSGPNLTDRITGTDPLKDNLALRKVLPKDPQDPHSVESANIVNKLSDAIHEKLTQHELNVKRKAQNLPTANIILLRGAGMRLQVDEFEKQHGLKGFMIAPTAIINGLGQTIGMDIIKAPGATGDYHSNYSSKIQTAHQTFRQNSQYNFAFVHIKAVDDAGHDKSEAKKIQYLQKVDDMLKEFTELIKEETDSEYIICLTGDHTTPVRYGDHTFEPVPVGVTLSSNLLNELNTKKQTNDELAHYRDNVQQFDELSAAEGVLGRFVGSQLLSILKNFKKQIEEI